MATEQHTPSRRALLGAIVAAPLAAGAAFAIPVPATGHDDIFAELRRVGALQSKLESNPRSTEATWEEWDQAHTAVLRKIEALPMTPQAARIRAAAIVDIYGCDVPFSEESTTDFRLARQIIQSLLAGGLN